MFLPSVMNGAGQACAKGRDRCLRAVCTPTMDELSQLRANADSLATCLHSLLQKIECMEESREVGCDSGRESSPLTISTQQHETIQELNGENGNKRRVTRKLITTRSIHAVTLDSSSSPLPLPSPLFFLPSRQISCHSRQLQQLTLRVFSSRVVVVFVDPQANIDISAGDVIREVEGRVVSSPSQLLNLRGLVTVTLQPSAIYEAPPVFYRLLIGVESESVTLMKGDIVQVLNEKEGIMQVRKVNDLNTVASISADVDKEVLSLNNPFQRGVIALVGSPSVGRRTLKSLLLQYAPHLFATTVPVTSREANQGEEEGREYYFWRKEHILEKIRDKEMVEWGELDNQLYGTWAGHVKEVIDGGRVCILDCAPQALPFLYRSIFKPFVVHIRPPEVDESIQLEELRTRRRTKEELIECERRSEEMAEKYGQYIHLTLVNRNTHVTFKRLMSALEELRDSSQYTPKEWNE